MMLYTIVKQYKPVEFENTVESFLKEGWILQGGVSVAVNSNTGETIYAQAMIKETK